MECDGPHEADVRGSDATEISDGKEGACLRCGGWCLLTGRNSRVTPLDHLVRCLVPMPRCASLTIMCRGAFSLPCGRPRNPIQISETDGVVLDKPLVEGDRNNPDLLGTV